MLAKPVNVSFWEEIVATLSVIVLQTLPVGEVVRGKRETCRSSERFPVHSNCTTEAWHYGGSRQRQNCLVVSLGGQTMGAYMVTHEKIGCRGRCKECVKRKVRKNEGQKELA